MQIITNLLTLPSLPFTFDSNGKNLDLLPQEELIYLTSSLTIEALYRMSGKELVEEEIWRSTQEIWDTIDTDKDEEITKEEFIANALNSEFITRLFSNI